MWAFRQKFAVATQATAAFHLLASAGRFGITSGRVRHSVIPRFLGLKSNRLAVSVAAGGDLKGFGRPLASPAQLAHAPKARRTRLNNAVPWVYRGLVGPQSSPRAFPASSARPGTRAPEFKGGDLVAP
jgi:hypothetical protein